MAFWPCRAFPAREGWTASLGSLGRQEKEGLLERLVLLAQQGTR